MTATHQRLFVVLGNQLFPIDKLETCRDAVIFMKEDRGLCTREKHHQQKLVLVLAAMRAYRDELEHAGFVVRYRYLDDDRELDYEQSLEQELQTTGAREDRALRDRRQADGDTHY